MIGPAKDIVIQHAILRSIFVYFIFFGYMHFYYIGILCVSSLLCFFLPDC